MFKYFFDILAVYKYIVRIDEYIIKVDHNTDIQKIREYDIHELLEGHRNISKCHKLHSACISTTSGPIFTN